MNIRKSELIQFASDIKNQNNPTQEKTAKSSAQEQIKIAGHSNTHEKLARQVRALQNDMNQLQTHITFRQASVAFLQNLGTQGDWAQELKSFMSKNFALTISLNNSETRNDFTSRTQNEMSTLQNNLLKKEVQLQNIFSSGLLSENINNNKTNLVKSADEIRTMFSKLQPESVHRLLKN